MNPTSETRLVHRWRQQIARHIRRRAAEPPRPIAAISYLTDAPYPTEFLELFHLVLVVVRDYFRPSGSKSTGLFGYKARLVPHGIQWGGEENTRLFKDFGLRPDHGGRGPRLNCHNTRLLELALRLERRVEQAHRYQRTTPGRLQLPRLWAGFRTSVAGTLRGEGPELEQLSRHFGMTQNTMFKRFERRLDGLHLYPLDWVSDFLPDAVTVFAELSEFPRCQVIRLKRLPDALVGFSGASAYDLFSHRSRSAVAVERSSCQELQPAMGLCPTSGVLRRGH